MDRGMFQCFDAVAVCDWDKGSGLRCNECSLPGLPRPHHADPFPEDELQAACRNSGFPFQKEPKRWGPLLGSKSRGVGVVGQNCGLPTCKTAVPNPSRDYDSESETV